MALSNDLRNLVSGAETGSNKGRKFASSQVMEALRAIVLWAEAGDTLIQWNGTGGYNGTGASALAPAGGVLSVSAGMAVTNAANTPNPFRQNATVLVTLTGTATGKTINGVAGPATISLVDGLKSVTLAGTSTGTIIATMSAASPAQLSGTDVLTVTLS